MLPNIFPKMLEYMDDEYSGVGVKSVKTHCRVSKLTWFTGPSFQRGRGPITALWTSARRASDILVALTEITWQLTKWREVQVDIGRFSEQHLRDLEADLKVTLNSAPGGHPENVIQLGTSLDTATAQVSQVFQSMKDHKQTTRKVLILTRILEAVNDVTAYAGRALATEAALKGASGRETIDELQRDGRRFTHEMGELGAFIEVQWQEYLLEGASNVERDSNEADRVAVDSIQATTGDSTGSTFVEMDLDARFDLTKHEGQTRKSRHCGAND